MTDTQWPRFMVFQQEAEGQPFVYNGTVHAPDIEMALQNARDVFVRRPEATALWVVPVEKIYSKTREEGTDQAKGKSDQQTITPEDFYVFGKLDESVQPEQLGEVNAGSALAALNAAIEKYKDRNVLRWYVFPTSVVLKSNPADSAPMFAPARDKTFKDQAEYPVVTMMRKIRKQGKLKDE